VTSIDEHAKRAIVTGAASGIGAAIAAALRACGVRVIGLDLAPVRECDEELICDVSNAEAMKSAISSAGEIDIAVTAAGYYATTDLSEPDPDAWRRMLNVHLGGTFNVLDAVLPGMYERRSGAICTVASELALIGDATAPHYAAAKGAVTALTKSVAAEAAPRGVRVNCLAPGPCDTPLLPPEHRTAAAVAGLPLGRLLLPAEVAATAVWLVLEDTNVVGQVVSPNAGAVL
jgi:NAD(P)-dependent dehydrogenase (short-subunit alcohol dehydrogenase family)